MSCPIKIKVLDTLYTTCEYCGDDKEYTNKVLVEINGKREIWFICWDCDLDCFGG